MKTDLITLEMLSNNNLLKTTCETLATMHAAGAPDDLMSKIGIGFLKNLFYKGLFKTSKSLVLAIIDNETIVAFVAATFDMKQCLRQIVISRALWSVWYGFSHVLFQPKLWRPFIEAMRLNTPDQQQPAAEILMIATADAYRGRGFGVRLLSAIDDEMQRRGVQACLARVREDNIYAIRMYERNGYREIASVTFNGSKWKWLVRELSKK